MECWSNGVVNLRHVLLHHSITPSHLVVLASATSMNTSPASEAKIWEEFSGKKALAHVQRLVDLGPHPAGSRQSRKLEIT